MQKAYAVGIIGLLLASNIIMLSVIFYHRDAFAAAFQRKHTLIVEKPHEDESGKRAKDFILDYYADVLAACGAAVKVGKTSSMAGTPEFDMACLIAGKRDVVRETLSSVEASLLNLMIFFKEAVNAEGIMQLGDRISFRPEGERKALLLFKHDLATQIKGFGNAYLIGILLGYDLQDINFFYQRGDFMGAFDRELPFSYAEFSEELKKEFQHYLKTAWIENGKRDRFEQDKKDAYRWLAEQEAYSTQELHKQIAELKAQVKAAGVA